MTTEIDLENEIKAKGLNAPRLTPDHIDSVIGSVWYFTAKDGANGAALNGLPYEVQPPVSVESGLHLLTICVLKLKNGFMVTGESACASPENFNAEIGKKIAYENAREKIWALEGYVLRNQLSK